MRRINLDWNEEPDTLFYPVPIPGASKRQRDDRRTPTAPKRPLILYFSKKQLIELRASVAKAIMKANAKERR